MADAEFPLTSNRPYLLRAMYQWLLDNKLTPQILVDAELPEVQVPQQHVNDGKILLNISPSAVKNLQIENDRVTFNARFSGSPMQIVTPVSAILAIFARENGQGMAFPDEDFSRQQDLDKTALETSNRNDDKPTPTNPPPNNQKKPSLKIVK